VGSVSPQTTGGHLFSHFLLRALPAPQSAVGLLAVRLVRSRPGTDQRGPY
jgi:hypothetical protein